MKRSASGAMAQVTLEQVSKVYPGSVRPAVSGVDLGVRDEEFVVLVGPSGCGKSTILRMIAGLEEATGGVIRIGERVVNGVAAKDRDVAMVFQNYALYPHMSVYRNMALGLMLRRRELGLSKAEIHERVVKAAGVLGIGELLERKPKQLSGGQRQRVALGRAIVRKPKVFLFDEPLSNLDAKLRVETRAELKKLHLGLKTTTIYVTHDQEEAMTLGDRIVVMREGVVQQAAGPLEVYRRPANRFVAGFVGMPPMNFMDGEIRDGWFIFGGGKLRLRGASATAAEGYDGKEVVLGVRAERLGLGGQGAEGSGFDARVGVVEPLGDRVDVYLTGPGGQRLVSRAEAEGFGKVENGGIIRVHVDLDRVHLFEPGDNGVNITLTRESSHAAA